MEKKKKKRKHARRAAPAQPALPIKMLAKLSPFHFLPSSHSLSALFPSAFMPYPDREFRRRKHLLAESSHPGQTSTSRAQISFISDQMHVRNSMCGKRGAAHREVCVWYFPSIQTGRRRLQACERPMTMHRCVTSLLRAHCSMQRARRRERLAIVRAGSLNPDEQSFDPWSAASSCRCRVPCRRGPASCGPARVDG